MTSRSRKQNPQPESVQDTTDIVQQLPEDAALLVTELELKLLERDELVEALTQRLEQAAEQLDRIKRTGSDRVASSPSTAVPAEFINQQQSLMDELQQTCQQWQDLQLGTSMGRVELQLGEIRDLVTGLYQSDRSLPVPLSASPDSAEEDSEADSTAVTAADSQSEWEALKATYLDQDPSAVDESDAESTTAAERKETSETEEPAKDCEFQELKLNDPPADINDEIQDVEALISAVQERDEYITYLMNYIRNTHLKNWKVPQWDSLQNVPEELCWNLQQLEKQLEDTLRLAEVELSMERARLGREEARLQQVEHDLQSRMKQAGMEHPDLGNNDKRSAKDSKKNKRWLKFMGKK